MLSSVIPKFAYPCYVPFVGSHKHETNIERKGFTFIDDHESAILVLGAINKCLPQLLRAHADGIVVSSHNRFGVRFRSSSRQLVKRRTVTWLVVYKIEFKMFLEIPIFSATFFQLQCVHSWLQVNSSLFFLLKLDFITRFLF